MKFFEKFSLTKLCAALQQKDWKEVERQQNKLGLEQFLARRGIGSRKPVAIVRPILKSSKLEIFCYLGDFKKQTVLFRATQLVSLKNYHINKQTQFQHRNFIYNLHVS